MREAQNSNCSILRSQNKETVVMWCGIPKHLRHRTSYKQAKRAIDLNIVFRQNHWHVGNRHSLQLKLPFIILASLIPLANTAFPGYCSSWISFDFHSLLRCLAVNVQSLYAFCCQIHHFHQSYSYAVPRMHIVLVAVVVYPFVTLCYHLVLQYSDDLV